MMGVVTFVVWWRFSLRYNTLGIKPALSDFLEMPFFNHMLRPRDAEERQKKLRKDEPRLTDNMTKTESAELKNPYPLNVWFVQWQDDKFVKDTANFNIETTQRFEKIVLEFMEMVWKSYNRVDPKTSTCELIELTNYQQTILGMLELFEYRMEVFHTPAPDFDFRFNGERFLVGEGKKTPSLPNVAPVDAAELCMCGLGTVLVTRHTDPEVTKTLREALELKAVDTKTKEYHGKSCVRDPALSPMAKQLLSFDLNNTVVKDLLNAFHSVKENLEGRRVLVEDDCVKMWTAVMQACFASVAESFKYTIVMSGKIMWFVELIVVVDDHSAKTCYARISNGNIIGSPGHTAVLLRFLGLARSKTLQPSEARQWQRALLVKEGEENKDVVVTRESAVPYLSAAKGQKNKDSPTSTGTSNRGEDVEKSNSTQTKSKEDLTARVVSVDGPSIFCGKDKYGIIPFFDQIKDVVDPNLGVGRCGNVKKIKWRSGFAALKGFQVDEEEHYYGRSGYSMYMHELRVSYALRSLWGKYVPAVLFHLPWLHWSCIGYQLGDPMEEDDMSLWSTEDRAQASAAIEAAEQLGWTQTDLRGRNFVRLVDSERGSSNIAMVDFESIEVQCATRFDGIMRRL